MYYGLFIYLFCVFLLFKLFMTFKIYIYIYRYIIYILMTNRNILESSQ